jgi:hypothetical protein
MKTLSTFTDAGWDFVGESANGLHDYWQMPVDGYPRFALHTWTLSGEGTPDNPYIVASAADSGKVWLRPSACYRLDGNLDLTGISWSSAVVPAFAGVFDGQGFVISNLTINQPGSENIGLFGRVDAGGQIRNLGVENVNITGSDYVGGLVGKNYSGPLTSCYATGSVSGTDSVGGLVGENDGTLASCYATGSVSGTDHVGGLVGYNYSGTLTFCYATGSVSGTGSYVGGLVGVNTGTLNFCYATGAVTGTDMVGGLVGYSTRNSIITVCYASGTVSGTGEDVGGLVGEDLGGTITSCYATGTVTGGNYVGGLVGNGGHVTLCYAMGTVSGSSYVGGLVGSGGGIAFCYATGMVSGGSYIGGLTGWNYGSLTACFWDVETSGLSVGVGTGTASGVTGKTTAEMMTPSTFTTAGWDFVGEAANGVNDYWDMVGYDYPRLTLDAWTLGGEGTAANPYIVASAADLGRVWLRPSACYRLVGNLDLTGISWSAAVIPTFTGVFDGQGFVISNLTINQPGVDYIGLFGLAGGQIRNLGIENANITGSGYVGGLVGSGGAITSCYATGTVAGLKYVGGLAGYTSSITSCYAMATVSGTGRYVGGLVGYSYQGKIDSCYATGAVSGTDRYVGGLVGYREGGTITACYATGAVSGTGNYVGGLVGENGGSITACYATGSVSGSSYVGGLVGGSSNAVGLITACYATGWVRGTESGVGGLAGYNLGKIVSSYATGMVSGGSYVGGLVGSNNDTGYIASSGNITSCYAAGAVSGTGSYVGGLVGKNYDGTISYCHAVGTVSGTGDYVGGLAGSSVEDNYYGRIEFCYASGDVTGLGDYVGGLVGENCSKMTSCYATGGVRGESYVGGLVGHNYDHGSPADYSGEIVFCYATGSASGSDYVGGLVGYNSSGTITFCYATGSVTATGSYVGGLVGSGGRGTASFWDVETSGWSTSSGGIGKTTAEMKTFSTFKDAGWSITDAASNVMTEWRILPGRYPCLTWEGGEYSGGSGTQADPYQIATVSDWQELTIVWADWDEQFIVTADIDLQGISLAPVGTSRRFTGFLEGNGHVIGNAVINQPDKDYAGLFGVIESGGEIRNLGIEDASITGKSYVGGLVGYSDSSIITACYVTGAVTGTDMVGGLAGHGQNSSITSCYAMGTVSGTGRYAGGLVGYRYKGKIDSCYATGAVSGSDWYVGGLVGGNSYLASITASFWDIQSSGQSLGVGGGTPTGVTGKTTAEMKTFSTFTDAGWDFVGETVNGTADVWRMCVDGVDYPRLSWEFSRGGDFGCPDGVGVEDLVYLCERWLEAGPEAVGAADANGDGKVDLADYAILAEHWLTGD